VVPRHLQGNRVKRLVIGFIVGFGLTMLFSWIVTPASAACNWDVCYREYQRLITENIRGTCAMRYGCSATVRWMHTVPDEKAEEAANLLEGREGLATCLIALNDLLWENDHFCNLLSKEPNYLLPDYLQN